MINVVRCILGLVLLSGCSSTTQQSRNVSSPVELRGVWLTNTNSPVLDSRASIAEAMEFLSDNNFNVVFPVVWSRGMTLYPSTVMSQTFGIPIDTSAVYAGRDPLAEVIEEAHKRNIAVLPWFEYGFAASYNGNAEHILRLKPGWAARDREGKILKKDGYEWMNPVHPEVEQFMLDLVTEVVRNYNVDGIQGSDKLPAMPIEGGYDSVFVGLYSDTHADSYPPLDIRQRHWKYWRAVKLNRFAETLYRRVKSFKHNIIVSWSPAASPLALDEYLQDWRMWISENVYGEDYADLMHPLIFRKDIESYKRTLNAQHRDSMRVNSKKRYLFPGILLNSEAYLIPAEDLKEAVRYNRRSGYNGEVFFSYEGLRKENDARAKLLKQTYYATPARLPFEAAGLQRTSGR